jgi:hypothetical protein
MYEAAARSLIGGMDATAADAVLEFVCLHHVDTEIDVAEPIR